MTIGHEDGGPNGPNRFLDEGTEFGNRETGCRNPGEIDGEDRSKSPKFTLKFLQENQQWIVPYSEGVLRAECHDVPHILATHCVLHATKSVGKLASVFEELDHPSTEVRPDDDQMETIKSMSADLVTAALRLANLFQFDLGDEHVKRVQEKNGRGY